MNTNLRSMIDAALDGQYGEQAVAHHPSSPAEIDLSGYVDHVGVEKLAHALVHVADNLHDIGSPEEKLAELEAFSHIVQDYAPYVEGGEFKLASHEEQFDGLGSYRDEFEYEDSLYGARQRALVKMAAAYGVPAEQLDEMLKESSLLDRTIARLGKTKAGKAVAKRSTRTADAIAKAESNVAKLETQATARAEQQAAQKAQQEAAAMENVVGTGGQTYKTPRKIMAEGKAQKRVAKAEQDVAAANKAVDEAPIGISGRAREYATRRRSTPTPPPDSAAPPIPVKAAPTPTPTRRVTVSNRGTDVPRAKGQQIPNPPASGAAGPKAPDAGAGPKPPASGAAGPKAPDAGAGPKAPDAGAGPKAPAGGAKPEEATKGFFDKAKDYLAQPGLGNMNMGQTIGAGAALTGVGAIGGAALSGGGGDKTTVVKAASLRKLAEDRINPARIRAAKADPFSGHDIHAPGMSRSANPYEPITIRAQRIRDRINADMKGHVRNVGGGYNLERYLNRFNR